MGQRFWQYLGFLVLCATITSAQMLSTEGITSGGRAAVASGFDYPIGTLHSGTISGSFANYATISVTMVGSENTISFTTGALAVLPGPACYVPGATCYSFGDGSSITVPTKPQFGTTSLVGGYIVRLTNDVAISAFLAPSSFVSSGAFSVDFHFTGTYTNPTGITTGSGGVEGERP